MERSLVVVQLLPALNNGGVERGTVEVANYLVAQGMKSLVISAGGRMTAKLSKQVKHINLQVGKKSLRTLFLIKKLRQIFIENNVDVVHARSRLPAWLAYWAIAGIKQRKPKFVTTVHGLYSVKKYSSIMARGDRVIAVSKTAVNYIEENYSAYLLAKPQLIYRGISSKEFPYGDDADLLWLQSWYGKYHQLVGCKMVLLPGRLTSLKGVSELELWLKSDDSDAKLVLTANPESDAYAARLSRWFKQINVSHRVVWVGIQTAMAELYAVADVVINCSIRPESFGRTVAESLAVGTPVVAYNHGGVAEVLEQVFAQGLVAIGDKRGLSAKINKVLQDAPVVPNKQPFLVQNMLRQTLAVYRELLDEH
jgi:glycosyltransferase involved in cell wall biosynthesis